MSNTTFQLTGLTCIACKKITEKRIGSITGVSAVQVDLPTGQANITSTTAVTLDQIQAALTGTSYQVNIL